MVELPRPLSPTTGIQPIQRRTPEDERERRRQQQNQLKKNDPVEKNGEHSPSDQAQTSQPSATPSGNGPTVGRKVDTYA
jgi:hypothetical protein